MAAANDGSEADEARRQEELAKKLAQLLTRSVRSMMFTF